MKGACAPILILAIACACHGLANGAKVPRPFARALSQAQVTQCQGGTTPAVTASIVDWSRTAAYSAADAVSKTMTTGYGVKGQFTGSSTTCTLHAVTCAAGKESTNYAVDGSQQCADCPAGKWVRPRCLLVCVAARAGWWPWSGCENMCHVGRALVAHRLA